MIRSPTGRSKQNHRISPVHSDLLQALNFAIAYKIYKEEENLHSLKPPSQTSTLKSSTKSKKGSMFERPVKTRVNNNYQPSPPPSKIRQIPPVVKYQQPNNEFYYDHRVAPKPESTHKSLNQFVSELSTPTATYDRMDESYVSYQKSNPPLDHSNNYFDFNSVNIPPAPQRPSNHSPSNNAALQKYLGPQYYEPTQTKNAGGSKNYQRFQGKKKTVTKSNRNTAHNNEDYQKHNNSQRQTDLESVIKSYREKLSELEHQRSSQLLLGKDSGSFREQHVPVFGTSTYKITDWTKRDNHHHPEEDISSIYESQPRNLYQPSPTKSSSLTSRDKVKKDKKRRKVSSSEESRSSENSEEEKVSSVNKSRHKKSSSRRQSYQLDPKHQVPKQVEREKRRQDKRFQKPQQGYSRSNSEISYSSSRPSRRESYHHHQHQSPRHSPSPSPREIPHPSHKPQAPKVPYSVSQKQICKFSNVSSQNQEDQLEDLNNSSHPNHLHIDLRKHKQYPSSEEQEEVYYTSKHHKAPGPHPRRYQQ